MQLRQKFKNMRRKPPATKRPRHDDEVDNDSNDNPSTSLEVPPSKKSRKSKRADHNMELVTFEADYETVKGKLLTYLVIGL